MSASESEGKTTETEASDTDSETSSEEEVKKKKRCWKPQTEDKLIKCNHCSEQFYSKHMAYKHSRVCKKRQNYVDSVLQCSWCNLQFKNRGNLATHALYMHNDSSYKAIQSDPARKVYTTKCEVCQQTFSQKYKLKYHIRKMHFNLQAKQPYAELKKVNQVWFEKVLNSNNIMEIKKTGLNTLVMRKLDENTAIKVRDVETETIDLSDVYPCDKRDGREACKYCKGIYNKRDLRKHLQEVHMNIRKHHCNNCNRSFKRSYQYLQHVCNKQRRIKGVRHEGNLNVDSSSTIRISSVESLSIPWA